MHAFIKHMKTIFIKKLDFEKIFANYSKMSFDYLQGMVGEFEPYVLFSLISTG